MGKIKCFIWIKRTNESIKKPNEGKGGCITFGLKSHDKPKLVYSVKIQPLWLDFGRRKWHKNRAVFSLVLDLLNWGHYILFVFLRIGDSELPLSVRFGIGSVSSEVR